MLEVSVCQHRQEFELEQCNPKLRVTYCCGIDGYRKEEDDEAECIWVKWKSERCGTDIRVVIYYRSPNCGGRSTLQAGDKSVQNLWNGIDGRLQFSPTSAGKTMQPNIKCPASS